MKQFLAALLAITLIILTSCHSRGSRSGKSFDEIRSAVQERNAGEVEQILGAPDSQQSMVMSGERWVWWNYTYLDGDDYPPELRGQVVHLQIVFEPAEVAKVKVKLGKSELRTAGPLGVTYTIPLKNM